MTLWTPEQIETLTNLWNAGISSNKIADKLGVTRNSVMGKISRLGLHRHLVVNYMPKFSKPHEQKPPTPIKPQSSKGRPIDFIKADHRHCQWPLWGPSVKTGKVCGAKPVPTKSYCAHHLAKSFTEMWSRRRPV